MTKAMVCFQRSRLRATIHGFADDDDDVMMPEGPPPGANEEGVDSDDDIPMPEGPPPSKGGTHPQSMIGLLFNP